MKRKAQQATESVWTTIAGYLKAILDIIVTGYMILIIAVMPFYFQEGYNHIGSDKSYFFRTYTTYAAKIFLPFLALYLFCVFMNWIDVCKGHPLRDSLRGGVENLHLSVTDFFAVGYALSVFLSYICSDYRDTALWGTGGWYMGMIPQLMAVGIYFAISRFWQKKDWMPYLILLVSAVVFVLGYLNRFDVWPIPMENSGLPGFISTIGNINWYCGYIVSVLFLGVGLFWLDQGEKKWRTILLALYCFIGFAAIVTQGSDSGIFALAVIVVVMFVVSARKAGEDVQLLTRFWQTALLFTGACLMTWGIRRGFPEKINYTSAFMNILTDSIFPFILTLLIAAVLGVAYLQRKREKFGTAAAACYRVLSRMVCVIVPLAAAVFIAMIAVNTRNPGSLGGLSDTPVFTFNDKWGSRRGATWTAGWRCFTDQNLLHKLVGVGPDCMADYIYYGGDEDLAESVHKMFGNSRLTNAHSEWLTILADSGLLGLLCFAGLMVSAIVRMLRTHKGMAIVCGLCILAYTCNNIWSFQQSMGVATIFVVMGIGENDLRSRDKHDIIT